MDIGLIGALLSIIVIDLVLSGDNAVVIGMAASRLPAHQRRRAIIWGGAGAVSLRIFFTTLAALLLNVPLLQAAGSILLFWIAFKLLKPVEQEHQINPANSLREALQTIIMADVVMSLDNILAVGGAAQGHIWLLLFGLGLSIPILLFGSSLIARAIDRYPVLNYIGSGILVITAARMFMHDDLVQEYLFEVDLMGELLIAAAAAVVVLGIGYLRNRRAEQEAVEIAREHLARVEAEERRQDLEERATSD